MKWYLVQLVIRLIFKPRNKSGKFFLFFSQPKVIMPTKWEIFDEYGGNGYKCRHSVFLQYLVKQT
jgi:hypothetical protein